MEGWDNLASNATITAKGWTLTSTTTFVSGRYPATAGQAASSALQLVGSGVTRGTALKVLPSTYTTLVGGCAMNFLSTIGTTPTTTNCPLTLRTAAAAFVIGVSLNASSRLQVSNSSSTVIATGTTVLNVNTWYYIELKVVVNGASGTCEVHLDGNTEIASTVGNFGSTAIGQLFLTEESPGSGTAISMDDTYLLDTTGSAPQNTFLGPSRIVTPVPTGAGSHTQWTPTGAASNFQCVNEAPPDGDTTYVADSTPGDLDSYVFGQADGGATIFAVQTNLYARKDDANTRQIATLVRQGGVDFVGTTFTEAASYSDFTQIYNQDPTGTNWTPAVFNADEFGVKEIA
jgi:hypothetical protein